jgi:hypothetical protein
MSSENKYRQLDEAKIFDTLDRLRGRISERFPDSGLSRVAAELLAVLHETAALVGYLERPHWPIRIAVSVTIGLIVLVLFAVAASLRVSATINGLGEFLQAIEAATNELLILGGALLFLVTLETRLKRRTALAALHQLRSFSHIVDLHQLTKDPERVTSSEPDTASSPDRTLTPAELGRYLDYCSELLSIISKIAALHVHKFNDPVALAAVGEIEGLTTGLSNKIWQKITLLDRLAESVRR